MADTALKVNLLADITDLVSKMGTAKTEVGGAMSSMESAFGVAKTAFVGLLGVGSVGAFATMIKGAIDAQGALHDFATQTGASAAALDAFRVIGATSGTSIDTIATMMNKLGKNMVMGGEDAKGAGIALKALGLDFDTIKAMKPEQQFLTISERMNQFADGADKGTAANALFGKGAEQNLKTIKDLGDVAQELTTSLTDQEVAYRKTQAAMADAFGDNLTTIARETSQWKRDLAEGMTPALLTASNAFLKVATESGGMRDTINTMSRDGTFAQWTQNTITGATYVMDAFSGLGAVIKSAGLLMGGWWAAISSGSWDGLKTVIKSVGDDLDATWGEETLGAKLRARMADTTAVGAASEAIKPQLDVSTELKKNEAARLAEKEAQKAQESAAKQLAAEIKKQEDAYNKLNTSLDEKIAAMNAETAAGEPLTAMQKLELKFITDIDNGTLKLTVDQLVATDAKIQAALASEAAATAYKKENDEIKAGINAHADLIEKLQKGTDDTNTQITKLTEHTATIGLNRYEIAQLAVNKDLDTAATWNQRAAWAEQNGLGADLVKQYKDQANALITLAGLKQQGIHVQAAVDAANEWKKTTDSIANGLASALTRAVMDGKDIWLSFRNYMVNTILDGMIKNALTSVIQSALSGLTSSIGSIFASAIGSAGGGGGGGVVSSAAGSAGGSAMSSIGSSIANSSVGQYVGNALGVSSAGFTGTGLTGAMGIGASAGTGVTTSAVVGGNGATVVGTELGLLGSGSAATTASTTAAATEASSLAAIGGPAVAAIMAAYIVGNMLDGYNERYEQLDSGTVPFSGTIGAIPTGGNSDNPTYYRPKSGAVVTYDHLMSEHYGDGYSINVDGYFAGTVKTLAEVDALLANPTGNIIPGYAMGGDFGGGARIVGEGGPELEITGPSRIFDAATTASMLRSGGANGDELVQEMRAMRQQLAMLHLEARRTADATNGNPEAPMIVEIDT
jgi:hypothetical protein